MFSSIANKGGRARLRTGKGLLIDLRTGIIVNRAGLLPGDIRITFDEAAPDENSAELDGSTIINGARENPFVAARYPWLVVGADIELPDVRGDFLRIWANGSGNDPDRASRGARAGDGQTGDYPGTPQGYQIKSHYHVAPVAGSTLSLASGVSDRALYSANQCNSSGGNETRMINLGVSAWMALG